MGAQYAQQFKGLRKVSPRSKIATSIIAFAIVLHVGTGIYTAIATPPIEFTGNDLIEPKVVIPGSDFRVAREFNVKRSAHVMITRYLVKGDCSKNCEVVDISQGYSYLTKGHYFRWREHRIPEHTDPGEWTLNVTMKWQDLLGFTHTQNLRPLQIKVL